MDQKVMDWVAQVCQEATQSLALMNSLERHSRALAHYYINVTKLHSVNPQTWAYYYPNLYEEAARAYAEYQTLNEAKAVLGKVDTLEEKLGRIATMLEALLTVQTPKQQQKIAEALAADESPAESAVVEADTPPEPATPAAEAEAEPPAKE